MCEHLNRRHLEVSKESISWTVKKEILPYSNSKFPFFSSNKYINIANPTNQSNVKRPTSPDKTKSTHDHAATLLIADADNVSIQMLAYCEKYHGFHSSDCWAFRRLKNLQTARNDHAHKSEKSFARLLSTPTYVGGKLYSEHARLFIFLLENSIEEMAVWKVSSELTLVMGNSSRYQVRLEEGQTPARCLASLRRSQSRQKRKKEPSKGRRR